MFLLNGEDHSRKPAYDVLKRLVRQEWWTDTTVNTDENGWVQAAMFKGDYQIRHMDQSAYVSIMDDMEMTIAVSVPCQ